MFSSLAIYGVIGLAFTGLVWALMRQGQGKAIAELKVETLEKSVKEANDKSRRADMLRQHPDLAERLRTRHDPK